MFRTTETRKTLEFRSGIYKITLRGTNRHYIGQSSNLWKRLRSHVNNANSNGKHDFYKLSRALKKYGTDAFDFGVLAFCDVGALTRLELSFIDEFKSIECGFNTRRIDGSYNRGVVVTEETRRKLSEANKGKKRSKETIERMRIAALNKPPMSEQARINSSIGHKGQIVTEAHREKLRLARLGYKHPLHVKEKMCASAALRAIPIQQFSKGGELIANN